MLLKESARSALPQNRREGRQTGRRSDMGAEATTRSGPFGLSNQCINWVSSSL
jgi:hypothetical protein